MIVKNCAPSLELEMLKALMERVPLEHPSRSRVEEEFRKMFSSYKGEHSIFYYLGLLPEDEYYIFHYLHLSDENKNYFQLDILVLSRKFAVILEVKNFGGLLEFDDFGRTIRYWDDKSAIYENPIEQVRRQHYQLQRWFLKNGVPHYPLESFVVIANPTLTIKGLSHSEQRNKLIYNKDILRTFQVLESSYQPSLTLPLLHTLTSKLLSSHSPKVPDLLKKFNIDRSELHTGVFCPKCQSLLKLQHGTWVCAICGCKSKTAHHRALHHYSLFISPSITNRAARSFFHVPSSDAVRQIFLATKLPMTGSRRWSTYEIQADSMQLEDWTNTTTKL